MFANYETDKWSISSMYKELKNISNIKTNNSAKKSVKDMNTHFSNDEI